MPTERFYRLPEGKRQAIREAALKEFARVPFEKASINQIIRNADISRGKIIPAVSVQFLFADFLHLLKCILQQKLHHILFVYKIGVKTAS